MITGILRHAPDTSHTEFATSTLSIIVRAIHSAPGMPRPRLYSPSIRLSKNNCCLDILIRVTFSAHSSSHPDQTIPLRLSDDNQSYPRSAEEIYYSSVTPSSIQAVHPYSIKPTKNEAHRGPHQSPVLIALSDYMTVQANAPARLRRQPSAASPATNRASVPGSGTETKPPSTVMFAV